MRLSTVKYFAKRGKSLKNHSFLRITDYINGTSLCKRGVQGPVCERVSFAALLLSTFFNNVEYVTNGGSIIIPARCTLFILGICPSNDIPHIAKTERVDRDTG